MSLNDNSRLLTAPSSRLALAAGATTAGLVLIGAALLPLHGLVAGVGVLASVTLSLLLQYGGRTQNPVVLPTDLEVPLLLASDEVLYDRYRRISALLVKVSQRNDVVYRDIALDQLDKIIAQLTTLAAGSVVYHSTETWRIAYELLLRSPGAYLYRSVAWIKDANYWQDEPGRKSLQINFELHEQERLNIERIAIVADELWPESDLLPVEPVQGWLHSHHVRGVWIKLVRESALRSEPDLLADVGIYGSRALGVQELDQQGRTARFVLTFDFAKVIEAEAKWNRLCVYAESYSVHLDRSRPVG